MENILKIIKSLEDSGLLLKGITETVKSEAKEQRGGFLSMLLGTLGASLLGDMLFGKKGKGVIRAYHQNEPGFIGVYSRDNLPNKIKKWFICNKSR